MSDQSDPFRMDTPANHRDGEWLAPTMARLTITQQIHDRGIHYADPRTAQTHGFGLHEHRGRLGMVTGRGEGGPLAGLRDYEQILDQRNDAPETIDWTPPYPRASVSVDFEVYIPDADDLEPRARIDGFTGSQPNHLVLIGEKSSLRTALESIATLYEADLYLPAGDPSDTMFYRMASKGFDDGRPMVVFYFSDADPSGWHMPIVCARKLQAFKASLFGDLEFQVHRVGLTPDQVREYKLPSTPLKASERRADKWRAAMGVAQTEIDALATLRPDLLRRIAQNAISPFFDSTLGARVIAARREWLAAAQARIDEQDGGDLVVLRENAAAALAEKQDEIQAILDSVTIDPEQFDLPEPVIPAAVIDPDAQPLGLCDSRWSLDVQMPSVDRVEELRAPTGQGNDRRPPPRDARRVRNHPRACGRPRLRNHHRQGPARPS